MEEIREDEEKEEEKMQEGEGKSIQEDTEQLVVEQSSQSPFSHLLGHAQVEHIGCDEGCETFQNLDAKQLKHDLTSSTNLEVVDVNDPNKDVWKEYADISKEEQLTNDIVSDEPVEKVKALDDPDDTKAVSSQRWRVAKFVILALTVTLWVLLGLYCYLFITTLCVPVELWCPTPTLTFPASVCCSALWLWLGAPLGVGNECTVDMAEMTAGCPMYDCYTNQTTGELNSNGCSFVPNTLFNKAACDIHDLCYITPGATKEDCDNTFVENIMLVYCDNVPVVERVTCRLRAHLAGAAVAGFDSFFDAMAETRATCAPSQSCLPTLLGMLVTLLLAGGLAGLLRPSKQVPVVLVERLQILPLVIEEGEEEEEEEEREEEEREEESPCYCDLPMANCPVCDEVFVKDLSSIECDDEGDTEDGQEEDTSEEEGEGGEKGNIAQDDSFEEENVRGVLK